MASGSTTPPDWNFSKESPTLPIWDFAGQTALISAGARGIGRGIVRRLAESGANVIFGDIDRRASAALESTLRRAKGKACFVEADFSTNNAWPKLLQACEKRNWQPTIGIANAGVGLSCPVEKISIKQYHHVEAINQCSSFLMAKTLAPILRKNLTGNLIFVGSVMSDFGFADYSLYGMTKNAVMGLTRSLAVERGIG